MFNFWELDSAPRVLDYTFPMILYSSISHAGTTKPHFPCFERVLPAKMSETAFVDLSPSGLSVTLHMHIIKSLMEKVSILACRNSKQSLTVFRNGFSDLISLTWKKCVIFCNHACNSPPFAQHETLEIQRDFIQNLHFIFVCSDCSCLETESYANANFQ